MSQVHKLVVLLGVLALLAVPTFVLAAGPAKTGDTITITLNAQNNSGVSGKAVLTDMGGGQTKVDVTVTGEPAGASEPMHIHDGSCATLGGIKFSLPNVVNGASTTTVPASLESLETGKFVINGHESATNLGKYVFCGDIPSAASMAAQTTGTAPAATGASTAAATSAATGTSAAPSTAPATGGGDSNSLLILAVVLGFLAVGSGLMVRRFAR